MKEGMNSPVEMKSAEAGCCAHLMVTVTSL